VASERNRTDLTGATTGGILVALIRCGSSGASARARLYAPVLLREPGGTQLTGFAGNPTCTPVTRIRQCCSSAGRSSMERPSAHGKPESASTESPSSRVALSPSPPEIQCARRRRDTVASFRIGSGNPRGLCPISAHSKPLTRSDDSAKPADLQVDQPDSRARHSDCHAEGRGFESLQPLHKSPGNPGFFVARSQFWTHQAGVSSARSGLVPETPVRERPFDCAFCSR
jgi:hypothetical protein